MLEEASLDKAAGVAWGVLGGSWELDAADAGGIGIAAVAGRESSVAAALGASGAGRAKRATWLPLSNPTTPACNRWMRL